MHDWKVIVFTFIVLGLVAAGTTKFNQFLKNHYLEENPIEEVRPFKNGSKNFGRKCPAVLGKIQEHLDCRAKLKRDGLERMKRKDI